MSDSLWRQAPLFMGVPRQEHWNGLPFPSPSNLPDPGIESYVSWTTGRFFTVWASREAPTEKTTFSNTKEEWHFVVIIHSSQQDGVKAISGPLWGVSGSESWSTLSKVTQVTWEHWEVNSDLNLETELLTSTVHCLLGRSNIPRGCKDLLCTRWSSPRNKIGMKLPLQSELHGRRKSLILKSLKYIHIKPELITLKCTNPSHITCYLSREGKQSPHLTSV